MVFLVGVFPLLIFSLSEIGANDDVFYLLIIRFYYYHLLQLYLTHLLLYLRYNPRY